ncbi:MAG: type II restriction endonuclease [Candidatus Bathyarchaeia archaeon]
MPNDFLKPMLVKYSPLAIQWDFRSAQRRKTRGGKSLEKVLEILLRDVGVKCEFPKGSARTTLKRIDLVVPDQQTALSNPDRAHFISCKRTLRERWKQTIPERQPSWRVYLVTVDDSQLFSQAEVFAMECAFSDYAEEAEKDWNEVSNGGTKSIISFEPHMEEFGNELVSRLTLKHKLVVFEKSRYTNVDKVKVDSTFVMARHLWLRGEREKAVKFLTEYVVEFASQSLGRDIDYSSQLREVSLKHPEKTIMCLRGPLHYDTLPILLAEKRVNFSSCLFTSPYVPPLGEAVVSRVIHGEAIEKETLTRLQIYHDFLDERLDYNSKLECSKKALDMTAPEIKE